MAHITHRWRSDFWNDFPITDLLDEQESIEWMKKYFHPSTLRYFGCKATTQQARLFRTRKCGLADYRRQIYQRIYNLRYARVVDMAGSNPVLAVPVKLK
jgi:hypothetical protein